MVPTRQHSESPCAWVMGLGYLLNGCNGQNVYLHAIPADGLHGKLSSCISMYGEKHLPAKKEEMQLTDERERTHMVFRTLLRGLLAKTVNHNWTRRGGSLCGA